MIIFSCRVTAAIQTSGLDATISLEAANERFCVIKKYRGVAALENLHQWPMVERVSLSMLEADVQPTGTASVSNRPHC